PSRRFLDYIGQVLPALGETAIVAATPDELVPGVTVTANDPTATEELKGRAIWQAIISRYVATRTPDGVPIHFVWEGERYEIAASTVERLISGAISGRRYHAARPALIDFIHDPSVHEIADRLDPASARTDEG